MADPKNTQEGINLPHATTITSTNPRRTSPENSVTLRYHRLAQDASRRHHSPASPEAHPSTSMAQTKAPSRNPSEESNDTGRSDPRQWFDQSNQNAIGTLDSSAMDVDPPFFQKETDSSNEETHRVVPPPVPPYRHARSRGASFRPSVTKSSSVGDYRSVIDDLTIENKRLREELKRLKQMGPDSLRNDKLFEVKVHGLPSRKRRELEATLRDFTTKLDRSSTGASTSRKKVSGKSKESSASKHASSTSGSNSRPVDSAYASMGTGPSSSSHPHPARVRPSRVRSTQNIEDYLRDIPEGLWPGPGPARMTEYEKKKLVVKRLEQLFTGSVGYSSDQLAEQKLPPKPTLPKADDTEMGSAAPKATPAQEGTREAMIRSGDKRAGRPHTVASASNAHTQSQLYSNPHSSADQSNSHDNDKDSGSGSGQGSGSSRRRATEAKNTSPQEKTQASEEQRPTRPRDLDPDRRQVPAENMEYIRHLGILAPESQAHFSARDVSPDAEGWVYLNLLGNLAQLHILNVTPDFIRSAVSEKSTKFQLSPDGRKIRWRGGDEGTRFTSDSGTKSQSERSSEDTYESNDNDRPKKKRKQKESKISLGVQKFDSSQSFHYKPLFATHQTRSYDGQTSVEDGSPQSTEQSDDSNDGPYSKRNPSGVSNGRSQRKRRRDGAIIYYSGAPFCTDLSGDSGEVSPDTYGMTSSGDQPMQESSVRLHLVHRPSTHRSTSGSSIPFRPLSEPYPYPAIVDPDSGGESDGCVEADFPWSDSDQQGVLTKLEASGLGGVYPEDHFVIVVSTRRPIQALTTDDDNGDHHDRPDEVVLPTSQPAVDHLGHVAAGSWGAVDSIAGRLALISTKSSVPRRSLTRKVMPASVRYVTSEAHHLPPVQLPPPTYYFPSRDSDSDDYDNSLDEDISVSSERSILSKRPMLECSPDSDNRELSGNDEEDEHSDGRDFNPSASVASRNVHRTSGIKGEDGCSMPPLSKNNTASSAATAGGPGSGYYSSMEDA
ncbi:putative frequency clock protein [Rosellinia necatrix]|uniref:Putative frequency clock protein n=1 Tax=Rosellinia necatrix TaxID=77044 RepID=A0A1W2TVJ8_ROSNE|nr:putative frequency clock protein [Rosellinia necatrix]